MISYTSFDEVDYYHVDATQTPRTEAVHWPLTLTSTNHVDAYKKTSLLPSGFAAPVVALAHSARLCLPSLQDS